MKLLYLLMMLCRCSVPLKFNSAENLASLRRSLRNYFFREVNYFFILAHCVVAEYLYLFGDNKGGCSHTDCVTAHRSKTTKITDLSHLYIHPSKQNALRSNMESNIASASHYLLQKALTLDEWNYMRTLPLESAFVLRKESRQSYDVLFSYRQPKLLKASH